MQLSPHFTLEELCFSSTAQRLQIPNDPPPEVVENLKALAAGLERVRTILGDAPLHIDSGYRCPMLNREVGGAASSAHTLGFAADFVCRSYGTPLAIVQRLKNAYDLVGGGLLLFDQLIQEGSWVHISFDPRRRREVLTAHFGANGTTYSKGA